jgi:hypothetical protein
MIPNQKDSRELRKEKDVLAINYMKPNLFVEGEEGW